MPSTIFLIFTVFASIPVTEMVCVESDPIGRLADADDWLKPYYEIGVKFLQAVNTNRRVDADHVRLIIDYVSNTTTVTFGDLFASIKPLIMDQILFICLFVFGLLFMILFPLVGLIFCCCRMSGNCGGKKYQKSSSTCSCTSMSVVLVLCVLVFATGATLYGLNNRRLYAEFDKVPVDFSNQTDLVVKYINGISESMTCGIKEANEKTSNEIKSLTNHEDKKIADLIMNVSGIKAVRDLQIDFDELTVLIERLNGEDFCQQSQTLNRQLNQFLTNFDNDPTGKNYNYSTTRQNLNATMADYCQIPQAPIQKPNMGINFTLATNDSVNKLNQQTNATQDKINDALTHIDQSGPIDSATNEIKKFSTDASKVIEEEKAKIDPKVQVALKYVSDPLYEYIGLIVIAPIALITLFLLIGLVFGCFTYSSRKAPFERSCVSDCGGCSLMTASGLMFIFGWLLMAITVVVFSVGYLTETAICQPFFKNPDHEVLKLIPNLTLDEKRNKISVDAVLESCKANRSIYDVFDFESIFDLDSVLKNLSSNAAESIQSLNLTSQVNVQDFNFTIDQTNLTQLNQSLNGMDLGLKSMSDHLKEPVLITDELKNIIKFLNGNPATLAKTASDLLDQFLIFTERIKNQTKMISDATKHSQHMKFLLDQIPKGSTTAALSSALTNETIRLENSVTGSIDKFIKSINTTIRTAASCRPLYDIYDNVGVLVCHRIMYPLHGFWLSLGLCVVFFLPAVICAIKLSKYFRRMDEIYYSNSRLSEHGRWSTSNIEMPVRKAW